MREHGEGYSSRKLTVAQPDVMRPTVEPLQLVIVALSVASVRRVEYRY